jgi:hypothetical protein
VDAAGGGGGGPSAPPASLQQQEKETEVDEAARVRNDQAAAKRLAACDCFSFDRLASEALERKLKDLEREYRAIEADSQELRTHISIVKGEYVNKRVDHDSYLTALAQMTEQYSDIQMKSAKAAEQERQQAAAKEKEKAEAATSRFGKAAVFAKAAAAFNRRMS